MDDDDRYLLDLLESISCVHQNSRDILARGLPEIQKRCRSSEDHCEWTVTEYFTLFTDCEDNNRAGSHNLEA